MGKSNDNRRHFISKVNKGKVSRHDFKGNIRYSCDIDQRIYILNKLSENYWNLAYNNPLPKTESLIASEETFFSQSTSLIEEIKWFFEVFKHYNYHLNLFTEVNRTIETGILLGNTSNVDLCTEKIEKEISSSLYLLIIEMYLNEQENNRKANEEIINELSINGKSTKLPLIAEFAKLRMEKDLPPWQYDSTVEHHMSMYPNDAKYLSEYIVLKFEPFNFDFAFENKEFIVNFESDFSVIDRLNSIQTILPLILHTLNIDEVNELELEIKQMSLTSKDLYWDRLLCLLNPKHLNNLMLSPYQKNHDKVADLFFEGEYLRVAELAATALHINPEIQELHSYFVKSIIFIGKEVSEYFNEDNVLTQILKLMRSMLLKDEKYTANREKLIAEYYNNSFFNFSSCLLQDLYTDLQFEMPGTIITKVFLTSNVISHRSIQAFEENSYLELPIVNQSNWDKFVRRSLRNESLILDYAKFYQIELFAISKIKNRNFESALKCLNEFQLHNKYSEMPEFVKTWFTKSKIKCLYELKLIGETVNLIIEEYFRSNILYDHYYFQDLMDELIENDESPIYGEISIPIFFQITKQSRSLCYDSIANFLIQNELRRPSELNEKKLDFDIKAVTFFLEKCCIKSHIEDSPYINSIDALSSERISILNCLKKTNPEKLKKYNEEILNITKEDTIRKGVKHIHESRIYVDTDSLFKILNADITEVFDRYLSLDNKRYSALSALTLDEVFNPNRVNSMFYCLEPVEPNLLQFYSLGEPFNDPNIVRVPIIRYTHFVLLFEEIKNEFIFNEDFGFKSFLSMRIRHGTFQNVLRNVFDKYNLIGSKELSGDEYKEINYWKEGNRIPKMFENRLQELLKISSRSIDDLIDLARSWIKIYEQEEDKNAMFDFSFSDFEMRAIFINRVGRINNSQDFIQEVFSILFDRMDKQLNAIRQRIDSELSSKFVDIIEQMETDVASIYGNNNKTSQVEEQILACKTEIQKVTNQVQQWFKMSQNQYVDEFPIEMILEASIDYTNSINGNILNIAKVERNIKCNSKYKGKYFEGFGDMLINIFDNIIKNNKDLYEKLDIKIMVNSENGLTKIIVSNNISPNIDVEELKIKIQDIKRKVSNYRDGNMANSFEGDSGYLKICRCISADLEQGNYEVNVEYSNNKYEVQITIENKNLII
ncbi:hypothetical protein EGI26_16935 [Lacihabitans sp. CCS-44]|uniref:hypothetical protein n=1 Tax=Lacihabitans sp. CCS-44 TaxID=2487331 RepID=UPI0020CECC4C|nr:hypothetical protein [Lacihabitans sp. CCS-44]MCP9756852.1 hypothetical protein [Lacihabitans sp. CCS-44]